MTGPERIATLMEAYEVGVARTGEVADGAPMRMPSEPPLSGGAQVLDGRSNQRQTQVIACTAGSCAHNIHGRQCSLNSIEVNERGGCADYEPEADEEEDESTYDGRTIVGIANDTPEKPDHPSGIGQMVGKFNDGAML